MNQVFERICSLGILILMGFIMRRTNYVKQEMSKALSAFVVRVTMPLLILTSMISYQFSKDLLVQGGLIVLLGVCAMLISLGIFTLYCNKLIKDKSSQNVHKAFAMFSNCSFLGIPVLIAIFGEIGAVYAMFYQLANDTLLWTLGVKLITQHKEDAQAVRGLKRFKPMVNANIIAFIVSLLFISFNVYPMVEGHWAFNLFVNSVKPLGQSTSYISMFFIGLILADIQIQKEIVKSLIAPTVMVVLRCTILPLLLYWGMILFVDKTVAAVVAIEFALPVATMVPTLCVEYDGDYKAATQTYMISTILSLITLPIIIFFITG